jgi:hypothetical protein
VKTGGTIINPGWDHPARARRRSQATGGGENAYPVRLANALLGAAQTEAILAESVPISFEARAVAYEHQFTTAGAADNPTKRLEFLRWQTLHVGGPLREIARMSKLDRSRSPQHTLPRASKNSSASLPTARMYP